MTRDFISNTTLTNSWPRAVVEVTGIGAEAPRFKKISIVLTMNCIGGKMDNQLTRVTQHVNIYNWNEIKPYNHLSFHCSYWFGKRKNKKGPLRIFQFTWCYHIVEITVLLNIVILQMDVWLFISVLFDKNSRTKKKSLKFKYNF